MSAQRLPRVTDAQRRALAELPVEFGAYGAPSRPTLRALIRKGLAKSWGGDDWGNPPDIVITDLGREVLAAQRKDGAA